MVDSRLFDAAEEFLGGCLCGQKSFKEKGGAVSFNPPKGRKGAGGRTRLGTGGGLSGVLGGKGSQRQ